MHLLGTKQWFLHNRWFLPLGIAMVVSFALYSSAPAEKIRYLAFPLARTEQQLRIKTGNESAQGAMVMVAPDQHGNFVLNTLINGAIIPMIFDTGANAVALTYEDAKRIGFEVAERDFTFRLETANGIVLSAKVILPSMKIAGITQRDIVAYILPQGKMRTSLLGRSFWERLEGGFSYSAGELVLKN